MRTLRTLALCAMCAAMCLASCKKPGGGKEPEKIVEMSPEEQKDRITEIGKELINEIEISNWESTMETVQASMNSFLDILDDESYDNSAILEWADRISDVMGTIVDEYESDVIDGIIYSSQVRKADIMIRLSEIKGHFTQGATAWTYKDAKDFQLTFKNSENKDVVVALASTEFANPTLLYRYYYENHYSDYWCEENYLTDEKYSIYMPKTVDCTVTIGGKTMTRDNLSVDYKDADMDGILGTDDTFEISLSSSVGDYSVTNSSRYTKNSAVEIVGFKHGPKNVIEEKMDVNGISLTSKVDMTMDDLPDGFDASFNDADMTVKVLDNLKVTVAVKDGKELVRTIANLEEADSDSAFRGYLDKIESLVETGVHIDGSTNSLAKIGLELIDDEVMPVFRFDDGSSYAIDEDSFGKLIDSFSRFVDEISRRFE